MRVCQVASVRTDSSWPYGPQPVRLLCPWESPGKETGVDWHALLQVIFWTQGFNLCFLCTLHFQAGRLPLAPPGNCKTHTKKKKKKKGIKKHTAILSGDPRICAGRRWPIPLDSPCHDQHSSRPRPPHRPCVSTKGRLRDSAVPSSGGHRFGVLRFELPKYLNNKNDKSINWSKPSSQRASMSWTLA